METSDDGDAADDCARLLDATQMQTLMASCTPPSLGCPASAAATDSAAHLRLPS